MVTTVPVYLARRALCAVILSSTFAGCSSAGGSADAGVPVEASGLAEAATPTDGGGRADGSGNAPPDAESGVTIPVSFAHDVMPIFRASCSAGAGMCHGDPSVVTMGLGTGGNRTYLGPSNGAADPAAIIAAMVGRPSFEDPSMNVVTAGDPTASFLMYKMDGELTALAPQCSSGDIGKCGALMPITASQMLPQATRDKVRAWIAQGANND
jgi:hypothetical protein